MPIIGQIIHGSCRILIIIALLLSSVSGFAQINTNEVGKLALQMATGIWKYNELPIEWDMKGESQALLNDGMNDLLEGKPNVAKGTFTSALLQDSTLWEARYYRAMANKVTGNPQESISDLLDIVADHPSQYEANLELGKVFMLSGKSERALQFLNKVVSVNPGRVEGHYYLGIYSLLNHSIEASKSHFIKCEELDSQFVDSKIQLGLVEIEKSRNPTLALPFINQVLKIDSISKEALWLRFKITNQLRPNDALNDINKLVKLYPLELVLRLERAFHLIGLESFDLAFIDIRMVMDMSPINENIFIGHQTPTDKWIDYQYAGRYVIRKIFSLPEADASIVRKAFCQLVVQQPIKCTITLSPISKPERNPVFNYLMGVGMEHSNRHYEAEINYDRALAIDDDIFDAHKKRGIYLTNKGQWKKAVGDFDAMVRLSPEISITYNLRGVTFFFMGEYDRAIKDFSHYLKLDTISLEAYGNRGLSYQRINKHLEGMVDLIKGKKYDNIDFPKTAAAIESLLNAGDTTRFMHYVKLMETIPLLLRDHSSARILQIRVMMVNNDWPRIDTTWNMLQKEPGRYRDVKYYSFLITARAMGLLKTEDWNGAKLLFQSAIDYDKSNATAYYERGKLMLKLSKISEAKKDLTAAAKLGDPRAKVLLRKRPLAN